ncbi:Mitochondrial matrix Mmp37 [Artemisia annua]|uniref:Phosphatidate cytidylyltransferase, mitochondrial n=1 Tax=Artemisia annua TaxID=35608 RepID=A0A2U1KRC1_ARTAN|nr:Mitochondrial matrix Mmp37 [Artemisia annua]
METRTGLGSLLKILPPVDFCCVYGSSLHPNNNDKSSMEDYILGVSNPQQWHSENLKMNRHHYASWMASLGGEKLITKVADNIGVGVHFNPFVSWNNKMYKYGVVQMDNLTQDMLNWENLYLSGRLQKPRELYAKICSLSYMGDLRMLFAEDKNKVRKIVDGQFELFRNMYNPIVEEFANKQLLKLSSSSDNQMNVSQDCSLSATTSIVSSLPQSVRNRMGTSTVETNTGQNSKIIIRSRGEAVARMQNVLRRRVMVSSARQAVAGFITVGAVHGLRYLGNKMKKAWKS